MLPNDNQDQDQQQWDPTVLAYLQRQKDAQAAQDATNQGAMTQDMIGAGTDVASALFSHPAKQAVYLQNYNDTSAPKMTQVYQPKANGDSARQTATDMRAAGVAKKAADLKDAGTVAELQDKSHSRGLADNADSRAQAGEERSQTSFDHSSSRWGAEDAATDAKNADALGSYTENKDHRDPNSAASKGLRDAISSLSPAVALAVKGQSYDDIAKGPYASLINAHEAAESRKQNYAMRHEDKQAQADEKAVIALKDDLDPNKNRGGNLAKNQAQVDQADRLKGLYTEANGDLRNLDSRQMEELAIGMNKMLSGSSGGSVTQVQALLPHSIVGNAQKLKEWLINDPQGANQQAFVKRMAETVEREREISSNQVKAAQVARLSGHGKLKQTNPDAYNQVLHAYGIEDADVNNGVFAPKSGGKKDQSAPATITHGADLP